MKKIASLLYGVAGLAVGLQNYYYWGLFSLLGFYPANLCDYQVAKGFFERGGHINQTIVNKIQQDSTLMTCAFEGALIHQKISSLELLIDNGFDIDAKNTSDEYPLFWAFLDEEKMKILIDLGANVNVKKESGDTPLSFAVSSPHAYFQAESKIEIVKILIENGADVNVRIGLGRTPLFSRAMNKEIAQLLIKNGADVNATDEIGQTPLFIAVNKDLGSTDKNKINNGGLSLQEIESLLSLLNAYTKELAQVLIDNGADVNARDNSGQTPLFFAKTQESVQVLIDNGANVNARDNSGRTPLSGANSKDVAQALIDNGANVNPKSKYGVTVLERKISSLEYSQEKLEIENSRPDNDSYYKAYSEERVAELRELVQFLAIKVKQADPEAFRAICDKQNIKSSWTGFLEC